MYIVFAAHLKSSVRITPRSFVSVTSQIQFWKLWTVISTGKSILILKTFIFCELSYFAFIMLTQLRVILGLWGLYWAILGLEKCPKNYFGVSSFRLSTFVFWYILNSFVFSYFGLFVVGRVGWLCWAGVGGLDRLPCYLSLNCTGLDCNNLVLFDHFSD